MAISAQRRTQIIDQYRIHDSDTGSPEVQVAILTDEIQALTEHLKQHKHDFSTRRGLLQKVSRRSKLTRFLERNDRDRYLKLIERLGLRK